MTKISLTTYNLQAKGNQLQTMGKPVNTVIIFKNNLRLTFLSRFFSRFSSRARFLARFSSLRFLRSNLSSSVFDLLLSTQRSQIFK